MAGVALFSKLFLLLGFLLQLLEFLLRTGCLLVCSLGKPGLLFRRKSLRRRRPLLFSQPNTAVCRVNTRL